MARPCETMVYLDHNATSPIKSAVYDAVCDAMKCAGNASSVHGYGRQMRKIIEDARQDVATLIGCKSENVIFTSGGTESINAVACHFKDETCVISSIEHAAVDATFPNATRLPVTQDGLLDIEEATRIIETEKPALVAVILANNETGVIQPIHQLIKVAHEHGALVHVDAVQALGKLPMDWNSLGADYMSVSAHKIGGPQGVGALIKASGKPLPRFVKGGSQEQSQRAGTENVAGIAGFGAAARQALSDMKKLKDIESMRDDLEAHIISSTNQAHIWGKDAPRTPNTCMVTVNGLPSETQVMIMDINGIAVGSGPACSSGSVKPSRVLMAMGCAEEEAKCCMRISLGWCTTKEDVTRFKDAWDDMIQKLRHKIIAA